MWAVDEEYLGREIMPLDLVGYVGGALVWEWLNWVNATLSLPLATVGFVVAVSQIRKTKTAAESARDAATKALDSFTSLSAASVLPQLVTLETVLDIAVDHKSTPLLGHLIQNWKWQADMCRALLEASNDAEAKALMKQIQKSIAAATSLKQALARFDSATDWVQETDRLRKSIGGVTGGLGSLSIRQTMAGGQSNE
ncbi:hypothetical protein JCM9803A_05440 [Rhodococcus erythropolis]